MDFQFNLNHYVKVKLTDFGIQILKQRRDDINAMIKERGGKGFGEYEHIFDAEGYTQFQAWDLMNTFGSYMSLGCKLPFELDVIFVDGKPLQKEDYLH